VPKSIPILSGAWALSSTLRRELVSDDDAPFVAIRLRPDKTRIPPSEPLRFDSGSLIGRRSLPNNRTAENHRLFAGRHLHDPGGSQNPAHGLVPRRIAHEVEKLGVGVIYRVLGLGD